MSETGDATSLAAKRARADPTTLPRKDNRCGRIASNMEAPISAVDLVSAAYAYFTPASSGSVAGTSAGVVIAGKKTQNVAPRRASGLTQMRPW
jgi:hypothetical protein